MNRSLNPRGSRWRVFAGLSVLLAWLPSAGVAATYGGGSGAEGDPYLIQTAEQFVLIGQTPADWERQFKLVNDIDLSAYDQTNLHPIGHWVIVGSNANQSFNGTFDGNGKTIRGFRYRDMQSQYVGLFQYSTGTIMNLHLVGAKVVAGTVGAGALVGYQESGAISGCSATQVNISGNNEVGALVGYVDGSVYACWSTGSVSGNRYVGGLVGSIGGGVVTRCYSKAGVAGNDSVGGLAGGMMKEFGRADSCYAAGRVDGGVYVGGLVGQVSAGVVFRCYSVGRVTGDDYAGGLVGQQRALGDVVGSLWDTQSSGQATSVGGTGKTTAEMKTGDPYLWMNWDFGSAWTMCEGVSYPILQWQIPMGDLRCPDGVNFTDFAWFAMKWRDGNCSEANAFCDGADLDKSGAVDPADLALFAANWLAGLE
ncbi:MAG: hypothetical protein ABFE01_29200 [Phycisphaerales bacterium]